MEFVSKEIVFVHLIIMENNVRLRALVFNMFIKELVLMLSLQKLMRVETVNYSIVMQDVKIVQEIHLINVANAKIHFICLIPHVEQHALILCLQII